MTPRILIIDDDPAIVTQLATHLSRTGAVVTAVTDGETARAHLANDRVDLILLDVLTPAGDGYGVLADLVSDPATSTIPIIVVTALRGTVDRVRALQSGADDVIVKPFDIEEVDARIQTVLRRSGQLRDLSPLTGLPGNAGITRELAVRVASGESLAVAHVDIDNFKAYNDHYGFLRGDGVITFCASVLRAAAAASPGAFVGHIGGDDFVVLVGAGAVRDLGERAIRSWDAGIANFYDPADAERGTVRVPDRRGIVRDYPLASLSIGVATNERTPFASEWAASAVAAEMKEHAKRQEGSRLEVDQRR